MKTKHLLYNLYLYVSIIGEMKYNENSQKYAIFTPMTSYDLLLRSHDILYNDLWRQFYISF